MLALTNLARSVLTTRISWMTWRLAAAMILIFYIIYSGGSIFGDHDLGF